MRDFINELMVSYHRFWMEKSQSKEMKTAHMNAMFYHIRKRSKRQVERMESKKGIV